MPNARLVYNPTAGRYPSWLLAEGAVRLLRARGWEIEIEPTKSGEHLTELAAQSAAERLDAFLVVGGDGSVNCALAGLVGSQTALGVLPAGTANVWAQELGLPGLSWTRWLALEESARLLAQPRICEMDVGLCNGRPFLMWAGVGLDGFIVHRIEPRQPWEKHFSVVHYTASALWNARLWHGIELEVEVDGQRIQDRFLLAVVSNVHLYAGGYALLSSDARLDDGEMDLWLFRGESLVDTVQMGWDLLLGQHAQSKQVIHAPFRNLRITSASEMYVQVDGEPVGAEQPVEVQVLPRAVRVLTPPKTPHHLFERCSGSLNQPANSSDL